MKRTRVTSSAVASVGYDPARQVLEIEFRSGNVYQYFSVPPEVHDALMRAPSKGRFVNASIRDAYPHVHKS